MSVLVKPECQFQRMPFFKRAPLKNGDSPFIGIRPEWQLLKDCIFVGQEFLVAIIQNPVSHFLVGIKEIEYQSHRLDPPPPAGRLRHIEIGEFQLFAPVIQRIDIFPRLVAGALAVAPATHLQPASPRVEGDRVAELLHLARCQILDVHIVGNLTLDFRETHISTTHHDILGIYKLLRAPLVDYRTILVNIAKFKSRHDMNPPVLFPKAVQRGDFERGLDYHLVGFVQDLKPPGTRFGKSGAALRPPPRQTNRPVLPRLQRGIYTIRIYLTLGVGYAHRHLHRAVHTRSHSHHGHHIAGVVIQPQSGQSLFLPLFTHLAKFERMNVIPPVFLENIK